MSDKTKRMIESISRITKGEYKVIWDLKTANPKVYELLKEKEWLNAHFNDFFHALPLPKTYLSFEDEAFYRPQGHSRACYLRGLNNEHIAIKGSEVTLATFEQALHTLSTVQTIPAFWHHRAPDYFVLIEKALPLALLTREALEEAHKAINFISDYLTHYSELPLVPLPLMVCQLNETYSTRIIDSYKKVLSERAFTNAIRYIKKAGLSIYIYYYPISPVRVKHERGTKSTFVNFQDSYNKLQELINPIDSIRKWMKLLARMFALGYTPSRPEDMLVGACYMAHNSTLDGGFCDMGSVSKIENIKSDHDFYHMLFTFMGLLGHKYKILFLTNSVARCALGLHRGAHISKITVFSHIDLIINKFIRNELYLAIEEEEKRGVIFDKRIKRFFSDNLSCEELFKIYDATLGRVTQSS